MAAITARRKATLETDGNGTQIQGFLHPSQTVSVAYTGVAGVNPSANPIIAQIVRIRSTSNCMVKFSSTGVLATAADMYLPANTPETFTLSQDRYISAIRDPVTAINGTLYITIMD